MTRIFGPKRDGNRELEKAHNEELHSLYSSPNTARVIESRSIRWAGHVARMEEGRNACKILGDKSTGKRPIGRPRMNLKEIGINTWIWIGSAQGRDIERGFVNATLNLRIS